MERISFIILHYGDFSVTNECIDSILHLKTKDNINIILLDNDTHKTEEERQSLQEIYRNYDQIVVLQMEKGTGFSKANNIGYSYAVNQYNPDYIIVMNNDIVIEQEDFLIRMKESYRECSYAVLSPDVVSRATGLHQSPIDTEMRTIKMLNHTIMMNWICLKLFPFVYPLVLKNKNSFAGQKRENRTEDGQKQKNVVPCGACIILSKDYINKEKKVFYPETQFYYEEYILHYRCMQQGYSIVFDPRLRVLHGEGLATNEKAENEKNKLRFMMYNTLHSAKIYKELLRTGKRLDV